MQLITVTSVNRGNKVLNNVVTGLLDFSFNCYLPHCCVILPPRERESAMAEARGQDYKEKHKLDSKHISDSPC